MAKAPFYQHSSTVLTSWVGRAMCSAKRNKMLKRLWQHDHTLWSESPTEIDNRLDWLHLHESMPENVSQIDDFVQQVRDDGFTTAVVLGMGGSSLAPEVFSKVFGTARGFLDLEVLDSTDPEAVQNLAENLDLQHALFIVSTKSGGTVETLSFFKFFFNLMIEKVGQGKAGEHFTAITDPGSKLEKLAGEHKFRKIFLNNPNIGGRYSALSYFGLVPAALLGINLKKLLKRTAEGAKENSESVVPSKSHAAMLGYLLGKAAKSGRDKITFISAPALESFEDWVEQLIAESTGKLGKGMLPVTHETIPEKLEGYSTDRVFAFTNLGNNKTLNAFAEQFTSAGHPSVHFQLKDRYDLGRLILLWEMAVALACQELGINPFDQPDVESAKVLARKTVDAYRKDGKLSTSQSVELTLPEIEKFLELKKHGDYISLQAYLNPNPESVAALRKLQGALRDKTGLPVTMGYGPRFLHSTGQLHKGDRGNGLFIQLVSTPETDLPIPDQVGSEQSFITFGVLKQAQAIGDADALRQAGRRVISFKVDSDPKSQLTKLVKQIQ
ncbi:MAG: glucose-6-phosphate isomerase [Chloroflexota bacterium]